MRLPAPSRDGAGSPQPRPSPTEGSGPPPAHPLSILPPHRAKTVLRKCSDEARPVHFSVKEGQPVDNLWITCG